MWKPLNLHPSRSEVWVAWGPHCSWPLKQGHRMGNYALQPVVVNLCALWLWVVPELS